jgi:hypothetical protein
MIRNMSRGSASTRPVEDSQLLALTDVSPYCTILTAGGGTADSPGAIHLGLDADTAFELYRQERPRGDDPPSFVGAISTQSTLAKASVDTLQDLFWAGSPRLQGGLPSGALA